VVVLPFFSQKTETLTLKVSGALKPNVQNRHRPDRCPVATLKKSYILYWHLPPWYSGSFHGLGKVGFRSVRKSDPTGSIQAIYRIPLHEGPEKPNYDPKS